MAYLSKKNEAFLLSIYEKFNEPWNASRAIGPETGKWANLLERDRVKAHNLMAFIIGDIVFEHAAVPEHLLTRDMALDAIYRKTSSIEFLPKSFLNEDFLVDAVAVCPTALICGYIPEHMITERICMSAVNHNAYALRAVPDDLKTKEMCLISVSKHGKLLAFVPQHLITEEICEAALRNDGRALIDVPEPLVTADLCKIAIENDARSIEYVPAKLKSPQLCLAAIEKDPDNAGKYIQAGYIPVDMVKQAFACLCAG